MAYITLNRNHLYHNLDAIATKVDTKEKIAIVLKDNAYGHGLMQIAQLANDYGIKHAIVRNIKEAERIAGLFQTILILADLPKTLQPEHFHITVNDFETLKTVPKGSSVELKCDTGMHRNGLSLDELTQALPLCIAQGLTIKGVFTHHRSADELSSEYFWQESQFQSIQKITEAFCRLHGIARPRFHSQNSAATARATSHHDLVRIGIAAYGLLEMPSVFESIEQKAVMALHTKKLHTLTAKSSYRFGYGGAGEILKEMPVSCYDIGYGDGLLRLTEEQPYTLPSNQKLLGRVSMDNCIISGDAHAQLLFDDARSYAHAADTIAYEVVVRLSEDLERIIN